MKNKAPLSLTEQIIMLLVLAVAAVLCLQVFLWADRQADHSSLMDSAMHQVQNAAEVLKSANGDLDAAAQAAGGIVTDGLWLLETDAFQIRVTPQDSGNTLLGVAKITAEAEGLLLTELTVCWQEVSP